MRMKRIIVALALAFAAAPLVTAAPAAADPNVPCWSRSTYISGGNYFNLTYKNCGSSTVRVQPYDEFYGFQNPCRTVAPGTWISWTGLYAPAWHSDWEARAC